MRNDQTRDGEHEGDSAEREAIRFDFEEFTEVPQPVGTRLYASLYPNGQLRINPKTLAALGQPPSVILFFDPHRQVIGVKANYNGDVPHAVRIRFHTQTQIAMPVTKFLDRHGIRPAYTIRFLDPYMQDGTLILDLNRTVRVKGATAIARERAEAAARAAEKPKKIRRAY